MRSQVVSRLQGIDGLGTRGGIFPEPDLHGAFFHGDFKHGRRVGPHIEMRAGHADRSRGRFHDEGTARVLRDGKESLAVSQAGAAFVFCKGKLDTRVGVELDLRAVGQRDGLPLGCRCGDALDRRRDRSRERHPRQRDCGCGRQGTREGPPSPCGRWTTARRRGDRRVHTPFGDEGRQGGFEVGRELTEISQQGAVLRIGGEPGFECLAISDGEGAAVQTGGPSGGGFFLCEGVG